MPADRVQVQREIYLKIDDTPSRAVFAASCLSAIDSRSLRFLSAWSLRTHSARSQIDHRATNLHAADQHAGWLAATMRFGLAARPSK
jgi:hypothetical protein